MQHFIAVPSQLFSQWKVVESGGICVSYLFDFTADLHQIIRSGQDLSTDHIAYFIYQIISGE
jgi:hypothetical protein